MKSENTKEKIILQTIKLINQTDGNTEKLTMRMIAESSGVGLGLINHYFISKENLIEICVQRIINGIVTKFEPTLLSGLSPKDATACIVVQVMDFLMENKQISQISILGDMRSPKINDNTMGTVIGLAHYMCDGQNSINYRDKAFRLVCIMQECFLRKDILKDCIGVDFNDKRQRDQYLYDIVEEIMKKK